MTAVTPRVLIIAPPPTPNGGLHLGHLSGPYLAADVISRLLKMNGGEVYSVISTDDFQTYVDVRADRLGCTTADLLAQAQADIQQTVDRYSLGFGQLGCSDEGYRTFIETFFERALSANAIEIADVRVAYDQESGAYLNGPEVPGYCARCFSKACESICECCGEPNSGHDLLAFGLSERVVFKAEPRLVVDLERYRGGLQNWLNNCDIRSPKMLANLRRWLDRPLGRRAISRKGSPRGISAPPALTNQTIDPWAEMYPGHFYHLESRVGPVSPRDRYLQFLGFDNGYFYTVLHGALSVVARQCGFDWPEPEALIINRFYNLGDSKFSTSQGHAIWANDFAARHDTDLIRFYLALNGPEHDEASFIEDLAENAISRIAAAINRVAKAYNVSRSRFPSASLEMRADLAESHLESCLSIKELATDALAKLDLLDAMIAQGKESDAASLAPELFTITLAPLMPGLASLAATQLPERLPEIQPSPCVCQSSMQAEVDYAAQGLSTGKS